jgi:uncharacterized membrane protein YkvA (DUF1232 family)
MAVRLAAMDLKTLRWWLIAIALLYLIMPRDLVFDFFGRGLGLIDDGLLAALLYRYYRNRQLAQVAQGSGGGQQKQQHDQANSAGSGRPRAPRASPKTDDPYEILGIPASATVDEIQAAYRARMREYHPDKVAHLGEGLQKLAHKKAQEIQQAYQKLKR